MTFSKRLGIGAMLALSISTLYAAPQSSDAIGPLSSMDAVYPSSLLAQGVYVTLSGVYSREQDILKANTTLKNDATIGVSVPQPWGYAGELGFQNHFGDRGALVGNIAFGYRYIGKLAFTANGANAAPSDFSLRAGTALVGLGVQTGRLNATLRGGAAIEIGGHSGSGTSTAYRFATRVVPMVGAQVGIGILPSVQLAVQVDDILGHQLNSDRLGTGLNTAPSGGYHVISGLVGITYFMS